MSSTRALADRREVTGNPQADRSEEARNGIARMLRAIPWLDGVLLAGDDDDTAPNVLAFSPTSARNLPTGLGRVARGFFVVDAQDDPVSLERDHTNLAEDMRETHIRLYHSGAGAIRLKVWVW